MSKIKTPVMYLYHRSSVVGSIGAIFGGLGFHEFINKYGIGRL
jgi:ClpP class serine protease